MALSPGTRLGPYEIVAVLGEGGMGTVYRARDPRLDRNVAVKVLPPEVTADPDRRQRFLQEARAVSSLNHPNIITVHDIGTDGDIVYMVMELVDGRSLDQLIPAGGFRVPEILRIGAQIADACARAHAQQIVHRDLKPANVMLQSDGRVKVLDFGLAKMVERGDNDRTVTQTAAGTIVGTVAYMSPEQAQGKPVDARTDIFSLGAVLYEMSTGTRAFQGDSQATVLAEVLKEEPRPPQELRSDLPSELVRVIMRCLRKDPARRVQSMADLRVALEELAEDVDSGRLTVRPASGAANPVLTARRSPGRTVLLVAASVVALGFVGWLAWRAMSNTASAPPAALVAVPLTTYPGSERASSFSPDGSQVAFSWDGEKADNVDIYVKLIGPGPPLRLTTDPAEDRDAQWSPDGRQIAFLRVLPGDRVDLMLVPPLGGTERRLASFYGHRAVGLETALAWTADSRFLFVAAGLTPGGPNSLLRVALDTNDVKTLIPATGTAEGYVRMALSPDGRRLAAVFGTPGARVLDLFDVSATGDLSSTRRIERNIAANFDGIQWTPDGEDLVFAPGVSNPLPLYRVSLRTGTTMALPWVGSGASSPVVSKAGARMVFTRDVRDTNIWRVDLRTAGHGPPAMDTLAVSSFREVAPQYSPDGRRLAFFSNRSGSVQIWTADADGSRPVQLTSMDAMATTGTPRWSPDNQQIVFDSSAGGGQHVYVIPAEGGQPRAVTSGSSNNFIARWSPDGRWIYFSSDRSGRLEVWRTPASGGSPEQVTHEGGQGPSFSPDGRWLYFDKDDGLKGVWRMPLDGGPEQRIVDGVYRNNFVPTAAGLYYVPQPRAGGTSSVQYVDLATGKTTEIAPIDSRVDLGLALSPDGRYLLFTKIDYLGADLMLVEHFQ